MTSDALIMQAEDYLRRLTMDISTRTVGSAGNRAATDLFARLTTDLGWEVHTPVFECIDWRSDGAALRVGDEIFTVHPGPYSLACAVTAPLTNCADLDDLETIEARGRLLLLHGALTAEQLMPKNYPFYNPEDHQRIIALLEAQRPAAIIAATTRDAATAGALYPFPLIEDGAFDIPSAYITEDEGARLLAHAGSDATLEIRAERRPAVGANVVATRGRSMERRIVVCAHIDAKPGTPGALDNATGVTILLLLAGLLADYDGRAGIELLAMNGEDHYSAAGELLYLRQNAGRFDEIALLINIDGAGYHTGKTAYSFYECPEEIESAVRAALAAHPGLMEGEPLGAGRSQRLPGAGMPGARSDFRGVRRDLDAHRAYTG